MKTCAWCPGRGSASLEQVYTGSTRRGSTFVRTYAWVCGVCAAEDARERRAKNRG